jgi:cytidylate kinase
MPASPDAAPVVTIDGPSGSGKGTVSRALARHLHWHLLDSGALYRLVALAGQEAGLHPEDDAGHARLAATMDAVFEVGLGGEERVSLAGQDVTHAIRAEEIGQGASRVAAWPAVRQALLARQQGFARPPGLVADGRDMGTVVFPAAALKVYLTASLQERALRRHKQLKDKGCDVSLPALSREIAERDQRDLTRPVAPLKPAEDAHVIDSTGLTVETVVAHVLLLGSGRLWA